MTSISVSRPERAMKSNGLTRTTSRRNDEASGSDSQWRLGIDDISRPPPQMRRGRDESCELSCRNARGRAAPERRSIGDPWYDSAMKKRPDWPKLPGWKTFKGLQASGGFGTPPSVLRELMAQAKSRQQQPGTSPPRSPDRPEKPRCEVIDRSLCRSARVFTPNCAAVGGTPGGPQAGSASPY